MGAILIAGCAKPLLLVWVDGRTAPGRPQTIEAMPASTPSATDTATFFASPVDAYEEPAPVTRRVLPRPAPVGRRHALIIGINRARGGRPLPGSIADAMHLKFALRAYGFKPRNVTVLTDGEASRARILDEIDRLAARTPASGTAVFAVATHTRRSGGQNELLTGDGLRISARELGNALGKVRSKMWVALPTCYAGGYRVPGIVGRNRIATFASSSTQKTYQVGTAGSYLIMQMVRKAMLEGYAYGTVEEAFGYAKRTLERERPNRVPSISDGIDGELNLGRMSMDSVERWRSKSAAKTRRDRMTSGEDDSQDVAFQVDNAPPQDPYSDPYDDQYGSPEPTPTPAPRHGVSMCGKVDYRC